MTLSTRSRRGLLGGMFVCLVSTVVAWQSDRAGSEVLKTFLAGFVVVVLFAALMVYADRPTRPLE